MISFVVYFSLFSFPPGNFLFLTMALLFPVVCSIFDVVWFVWFICLCFSVHDPLCQSLSHNVEVRNDSIPWAQQDAQEQKVDLPSPTQGALLLWTQLQEDQLWQRSLLPLTVLTVHANSKASSGWSSCYFWPYVSLTHLVFFPFSHLSLFLSLSS